MKNQDLLKILDKKNQRILKQEEELKLLRSHQKPLSAENYPGKNEVKECELFVRNIQIFFDGAILNEHNDRKLIFELTDNATLDFRSRHMPFNFDGSSTKAITFNKNEAIIIENKEHEIFQFLVKEFPDQFVKRVSDLYKHGFFNTTENHKITDKSSFILTAVLKCSNDQLVGLDIEGNGQNSLAVKCIRLHHENFARNEKNEIHHYKEIKEKDNKGPTRMLTPGRETIPEVLAENIALLQNDSDISPTTQFSTTDFCYDFCYESEPFHDEFSTTDFCYESQPFHDEYDRFDKEYCEDPEYRISYDNIA